MLMALEGEDMDVYCKGCFGQMLLRCVCTCRGSSCFPWSRISKAYLEMPGIEPGASHMQSVRSTTELHPLISWRSLCLFLHKALNDVAAFNPAPGLHICVPLQVLRASFTSQKQLRFHFFSSRKDF